MAIFEILFYAQGIIVPMTIFVEPYIKLKLWAHFLQALDVVRCRTVKWREDPALEDKGLKPLFMFMNTGLNVEMVYVILTGISTHLQATEMNMTKDSILTESDKQRKKNHDSNTTVREALNKFGATDLVISMKNYTIKDVDLWRDNSSQDLQFDLMNSRKITVQDKHNASRTSKRDLFIDQSVTIILKSVNLF